MNTIDEIKKIKISTIVYETFIGRTNLVYLINGSSILIILFSRFYCIIL